MPPPLVPEKLEARSVVTPAQSIEYFHDEPPVAPDVVLLTYQRALSEYVETTFETTTFEAFGQGYRLEETDGSIGVVQVPGAPSAALAMEELIARGSTTFVSVGYAGALSPGAKVGDVVVVDRAFRDEGTSYHYLEPSRSVEADTDIVGSIVATLETVGEPFAIGPTWTTDAPHRETGIEIDRYRDEGVLAVDMEAAGVFAIAAYRNVSAGAVFTVSDVLDPEGWEPAFEKTLPYLEVLIEHVIEAMGSRPD